MTFFYLNASDTITNYLKTVPEYKVGFSFANKHDCVDQTLGFLGVISRDVVESRCSLHNSMGFGTVSSEIQQLLESKYKNKEFNLARENYTVLSNQMNVSTATVIMLYNIDASKLGHVISFVKGANNILYLVDIQNNVKCSTYSTIDMYLNSMNMSPEVGYFTYKTTVPSNAVPADQYNEFTSGPAKRGFSDTYTPLRQNNYSKKQNIGKSEIGGKRKNKRTKKGTRKGKKKGTRKGKKKGTKRRKIMQRKV
jgi:hypothetical protein